MAITEIKDTDKLIDSVSVLNNNFNYLNNNKANNSTTLSGYGITDTYTKTEADNRYLKLIGGNINGSLNIIDNIPIIYFRANGTRSDIYFQDNTTNTNYACIRCETDGSLQIGRKHTNGSAWYNGARINLEKNGEFALVSSNGSNVVTLRGYSDGSLKWQTKEVERVSSSGTNYIRYESGLQICYGVVTTTVSAGSENTVTLGANFMDGYYTVVMGCVGDNLKTVYAKSRTVSNFKYITDSESGYSFSYIAIGYWK